MTNPNMMWRAIDEVAKAIHDEVVDGCPHEGWGGYVFSMGGQIIDAKVKDNELIIEIEFDEDSGHDQGRYELILKPTDWRRSAPKKRKRQRAKDIRVRRR